MIISQDIKGITVTLSTNGEYERNNSRYFQLRFDCDESKLTVRSTGGDFGPLDSRCESVIKGEKSLEQAFGSWVK